MNQLEDLLVDTLNASRSVADSRLAGLTPDQWREFLAIAAHQQVRPLLWHRLRQKGLATNIPDDVAATLKEAHNRNALRNLRLYGELRKLLTLLQTEDIPVVLLKGIYLADAVYDNIGLREMSDIDILVHAKDLQRVVDVLVGMGYGSSSLFSPDVAIAVSRHLPSLVKNGYASFEIHWNLTAPNGTGYAEPDLFWELAVTTRVSGCHALALSPETLLLHICYHTSYQHLFAFGLRPSCDIAAVIAHFGPTIGWQGLVNRARLLGWQRGIYLALLLARDLAGAQVPENVLGVLRPAEMAEDIPAAARIQLFSDKGVVEAITPHFAELLGKERLKDKCRIFLRRVFLPKARIASLYSIPADSPLIYACYPRRMFELWHRHSGNLKKHRHDAEVQGVVERRNYIGNWLAEDKRQLATPLIRDTGGR